MLNHCIRVVVSERMLAALHDFVERRNAEAMGARHSASSVVREAVEKLITAPDCNGLQKKEARRGR
jgi:Arc/MetJ-type ribon-helix-helix transcriptional regulator